jgi:hypothetical protein
MAAAPMYVGIGLERRADRALELADGGCHELGDS